MLASIFCLSAACSDEGDAAGEQRVADGGKDATSSRPDSARPDGDGAPDCGEPKFVCVNAACDATDVFSFAVCSDGGWTCPPDTVPKPQCPVSCFMLPFWCCFPDGRYTPPHCDDLNRSECPPGSETCSSIDGGQDADDTDAGDAGDASR